MKIEVNPRNPFSPRPEVVATFVMPSQIESLVNAKKAAKQSSKSSGWIWTIEEASRRTISQAVARDGFTAELGQTISLPLTIEGRLVEVLLYGIGDEVRDRFGFLQGMRKAGALVGDAARRVKASHVVVLFDEGRIDAEAEVAFSAGLELGVYRFTRYKSPDLKATNPNGKAEWKPEKLRIAITGKKLSRRAIESIEEGQVIARATNIARDLVNTPARDCTPRALVDAARRRAQVDGLKFEVLDRAKLESLGAHTLLSVAQGSEEPPFLIKLTHKPHGTGRKGAKKVISLVGKGVTFDSGGYSLKTPSGMETMKIDMSGAAAVVGALSALSALDCPVEVRGYIPTVENMVSGRATRPGDVVRGLGNKSIEILNTDAEGRLILSDALVLAEREECDQIIDIATLTGACMVALGTEYAGLFTDDEKLARGLLEAGEREGERLWRLPLAPEYKELIKSPIADIKNTGGPYGGAITAALFLKEFIKETPWAHLDIAGPASSDSDKGHIRKGATGFGVRTLARYLLSL